MTQWFEQKKSTHQGIPPLLILIDILVYWNDKDKYISYRGH